jgi:uncharacterized membrane protein
MVQPRAEDVPTGEHIDDTLRSIDKLRADHASKASKLQRVVDRLTVAIGRPRTVIWLTILIAIWIIGNLVAPHFGLTPLDPPPFFWLEIAASMVALYLVIFILASQKREDDLAQRRELLALELAVRTEQKAAKMIELLEEFRRDSPQINDRVDEEAQHLSVPADPSSVASAISAAGPQSQILSPSNRT